MTSLPGSGGAPRRRLVALAGFMGSGKTTIGSLLARQLGWRFADLDTLIERAAGHAITEIFERHGEAAFREVEREQLLAALGRAAVRVSLGWTTTQADIERFLNAWRKLAGALSKGSKEQRGIAA